VSATPIFLCFYTSYHISPTSIPTLLASSTHLVLSSFFFLVSLFYVLVHQLDASDKCLNELDSSHFVKDLLLLKPYINASCRTTEYACVINHVSIIMHGLIEHIPHFIVACSMHAWSQTIASYITTMLACIIIVAIFGFLL
jgi:hypothetical protein